MLVAVLLVACGGATRPSNETVTVLAAASVGDALVQLAEGFARSGGAPVVVEAAGTPTLVQQVLEGAPADVLAAADAASLEPLTAADAIAGEPRVFARNHLTLVVEPGNPRGVQGLADLARPELVVALADEDVPAGRYARQALTRAGVVASPDTLEPSVSSIITKVTLGEVDVGLVYATDVLANAGQVEGVAVAAEHDVEARYVIAVLAGARHPAAARAFVEHALSPDGVAALVAHGFSPP